MGLREWVRKRGDPKTVITPQDCSKAAARLSQDGPRPARAFQDGPMAEYVSRTGNIYSSHWMTRQDRVPPKTRLDATVNEIRCQAGGETINKVIG